MEIGKAVKAARMSKGKTQAVLAVHCGLSLRAISSIEQGAKSPTVTTLAKIGRGLDIAPYKIVRYAERLGKRKTL